MTKTKDKMDVFDEITDEGIKIVKDVILIKIVKDVFFSVIGFILTVIFLLCIAPFYVVGLIGRLIRKPRGKS